MQNDSLRPTCRRRTITSNEPLNANRERRSNGMKQVRLAWLAWAAAAMLFFSGTRAPALILVLVTAGFGLLAGVVVRALMGKGCGHK